ncbi:SAG family member [Eimeria mitis]|uniref:SAG family member n=1 Tax=Eimeria mitis TaxID=44415 RepID=U6KDN8_9EIME|nr:SAG family member [Eimeria mitis]CDJ33603.1 SAG family member [Eimeria mitis]
MVGSNILQPHRDALKAKPLTACASLLLFAKVDGSGGQEPETPTPTPNKKTTYAVKLGENGACLSDINDARKKAGFNDFVIPQTDAKEKRLPEEGEQDSSEYDEWVWKPVCDVLIPQEAARKSSEADPGKKFMSGTYAFQVVDAANLSCTAVVEKWKNAYSNFNGLPPPNKDTEELYASQDNISFVAVHNPSADATADCRVVTCTRKISNSPTSLLLEQEEEDNKTEETKEGSALICMTTPDVLPANSDNPPFT